MNSPVLIKPMREHADGFHSSSTRTRRLLDLGKYGVYSWQPTAHMLMEIECSEVVILSSCDTIDERNIVRLNIEQNLNAKMTRIVDDKSQYCIPFILGRLDAHNQRYANVQNAPPFFLGLNGVQGAGKTVLVRYGAYLKDWSSLNSPAPTASRKALIQISIDYALNPANVSQFLDDILTSLLRYPL